MTSGIPIRMRRTVHEEPIDTMQLGGMLWHIIDQKFGVYNGTQVCWYPGVDPTRNQFILNKGQDLVGKDANGDFGKVSISFKVPGQMQILSDDGSIIASFSADGTTTFANPIVEDLLPGGSYQKVTHPGFIPEMFSTSPKSTDTFTGFVGPNTYLWRKEDFDGQASVRYAYKDGGGALTHHSAEAYTLEYSVVAPSGKTEGLGLRSWLLDSSLSSNSEFTNTHKLFVSVYGPINGSNVIRVGRDGNYVNTTVETNGAWKRVAVDLPFTLVGDDYLHSESSPISVDWFTETTPGVWYISEPSIQNVDVVEAEIYQYRTLAERVACANACYWNPPTQRFTADEKKVYNLPTDFPILHSKATYSMTTISTERPLVISAKTVDGFDLSTSNNAEGDWTCNFVIGFHGSLIDIT